MSRDSVKVIPDRHDRDRSQFRPLQEECAVVAAPQALETSTED